MYYRRPADSNGETPALHSRLHTQQGGVESALRDQSIMRAGLSNPPALENPDAVRIANSGKPVRNNHARTILRNLRKRTLNRRLGLVVDCRCGFVEDENLRITYNRTS